MQIKPNKSLPRQAMGLALSFTARLAVSSLFLHRISVVCVNLSCLIHNAADTVGRCLHQLSGLSAHLQTKRSSVRFPVREHAWVVGQVPNYMHVRGNPIDVSLPLFLSSLLSKNK